VQTLPGALPFDRLIFKSVKSTAAAHDVSAFLTVKPVQRMTIENASNKMKAAVRSQYGSANVLRIKEIAKPRPKENEVLIRVHAATVNRTDCGVLLGKPYVMRVFTGWRRPRSLVTGSDFAGQIEEIGRTVKMFNIGDRVMGFGGVLGCGSHAQYLCLPETKAVLTIPENLRYEEAAACMEGAFYAASGIEDLQPKAGQKAVVNGATGAIGSALVQLLKYRGLSVTAVCRGEHEALVWAMGADKVIDYTKDDFTKDSEAYDYVFDAVGKSSFWKCKRLLKKMGIYAPTDGMLNLFLALITPLFGGKKVVFSPPRNIRTGIAYIKELIQKGSFRPVVDRKYPMEKIPEAFNYVATGQKVGNVIITMDN
jgi:NADPH:quinone reductase-like Zn-dependent oxidoreductase